MKLSLVLFSLIFCFCTLNVQAQSSVTDSTKKPLFVLDGKILESQKSEETLKNLDPQTIQKIDVYKGAEAQALYGLKGANGVVVITTKKEKSKPKD